MKKTILSLLIITCFSVFCMAQNTITLTANFVKGDTLKYAIEEGKKKYENDKIIDSTITTKKMNLIVMDSTDKGFLMQIDMPYEDEKAKTLMSDMMSEESNWAFFSSIKDLKVQYRISPTGIFQGFENMDILIKVMEKAFDSVFSKMNIEADKKEKLKTTFKNPQFMETILGKYVTLLHAFHGYEYEADTVKTLDNPLPNIFSKDGGTIPAKSEFLIEYADTSGVYAQIQQVTVADKKAMKNLMVAMGDSFSWDKKQKKEAKNTELDLYHRLECEFHLPSGIPTYLFFKKIVEGKGKKKEDTFVVLDYIEITLE